LRKERIEEVRKQFLMETGTKGLGVTDLVTRRQATRIVWAGDFHIPFHNERAIEQMLEEEAGADYLIVGGDLMDCYSISKFKKSQQIDLFLEYQTALKYIDRFSKLFGKVILLQGNHDERLNTLVDTVIPPEAKFLFRRTLIDRLAAGEVFSAEGEIGKPKQFKNVIAVEGTAETRWYTRIGQTIFAHPTKALKIEGRTVEQCLQYFRDRFDNIDSIVIGHTHHLGRHYAHGRLCVEGGCMCLPLEYSHHASAKYSPVPNGYSVIVQDSKGKTDYNLSHEVFLGITQYRKEVLGGRIK